MLTITEVASTDSKAKGHGKENDSATPKKKTVKPKTNDAQLSKLETLHERTGVKGSLGLGEGRRLKLSDGRPPPRGKAKAAEEPDFKIDFTEISEAPRQETETRESSEDLPDVQTVLAEHDHQNRSKALDTASDDYSDSEVDALMMTVDSTGALQDGLEDPDSRRAFDGRAYAPKRGLDDVLSNHSSPEPKSPLTKRARLSSDPLFLHDSSLAASPIFDRNDLQPAPMNAIAEPGRLEIEDFFSLDDNIFKITPSFDEHNSELTHASSSTLATDSNAVSKTRKSDAAQQVVIEPPKKEEKTVVAEGQDSGYDYDFLADLDDWIENSGCIRIVDKLE